MATGDTAPPFPIPPPQIEPLSDDASSPLSDVEDKDGDADELDSTHQDASNHRDRESSSDLELSDANDTEAETERLQETPQNSTRQKDVVVNRFADTQVFERTPSKLRHINTASGGAEEEEEEEEEDNGDDDDDDDDEDDAPLSEEEVSMASSPPAQPAEPQEKLQSPTLDILAEVAKQQAESRKRKRVSANAEPGDAEQPSRKRTGSIPARSGEGDEGEIAVADEDEPSTHPNSGEHSADETTHTTTAEEDLDEHIEDGRPEEDAKPKKQTRSSSKKRQSSEELADGEEAPEEAPGTRTADEDGAHTGDDERLDGDVDEEAEAAHRNEEERGSDVSNR